MLKVHLCGPLHLHGPFTCMGPFASVWPFYTYIRPSLPYGALSPPWALFGGGLHQLQTQVHMHTLHTHTICYNILTIYNHATPWPQRLQLKLVRVLWHGEHVSYKSSRMQMQTSEIYSGHSVLRHIDWRITVITVACYTWQITKLQHRQPT